MIFLGRFPMDFPCGVNSPLEQPLMGILPGFLALVVTSP